ncbi:hypothetical protein [Laceyella putida]|uniref:Uncharacterized protein n=1 Tax=Laceyella putida TaxID=110101 RepID=A0ABW2RJE0_9BACL
MLLFERKVVPFISAIGLSFSLILSSWGSVNAEESTPDGLPTPTDSETIAVYEVENGQIVREVSIEEYQAIQETPAGNYTANNSVTTRDVNGAVAIYRQDVRTTSRQAVGRVSRIVENKTSSPATYSISYSATRGVTYSVSVSGLDVQAIKNTLGASWTIQRSVTDNATLTVKPGYRGWWHFDANVNVSKGYLTKIGQGGVVISKRYITTTSPRTVSGMLDGWLVAKQSKL